MTKITRIIGNLSRRNFIPGSGLGLPEHYAGDSNGFISGWGKVGALH
ncbi:MAG: hypothetical protein ACYCOO_04010 [Chitinophagaceae bacterium]